MPTLHYYLDGESTKAFSKEMLKSLDNNGLTEKNKISFVGLFFHENNFYFFLPKMHLIADERSNKIFAKNLIKSFGIYSGDSKQFVGADISENDLYQDLECLNYASAYLAILNYYKLYGTFRKRKSTTTRSNLGKVNWKATQRKISPLVNTDGTPVYEFSFISKSKNQELLEIVKIQKYLTKVADSLLGWLYTNSQDQFLFPELQSKNITQPESTIKMISVVENELRRTFNSSQIQFLKNLLLVLKKQQTFSNDNSYVFGVKKFWPIWEDMCKKIFFDNSKGYIKKFPIPKYIKNDIFFAKNDQTQLPDIILKIKENEIVLLDAKYYDFKSSLPSWYDIIKQIFYKKTIEKIESVHIQNNAFVLPFDGETVGPNEVYISNLNTLNPFDLATYPKIDIVYYPIHIAIENYVQKRLDRAFILKELSES